MRSAKRDVFRERGTERSCEMQSGGACASLQNVECCGTVNEGPTGSASWRWENGLEAKLSSSVISYVLVILFSFLKTAHNLTKNKGEIYAPLKLLPPLLELLILVCVNFC